MNAEEILDYDLDGKEKTFYEPRVWWEERRIWYNVLLVGLIVLVMVYYKKGTQIYGVSNAIFDSIIVCIIANLFYSIGWIFEMMISYSYSKFRIPPIVRMFLFLLGVLFSLWLAFNFYSIELKYLEYQEIEDFF